MNDQSTANDSAAARANLRSLSDEDFHYIWPRLESKARSVAGIEFIDRFRRLSSYKPKLNGSTGIYDRTAALEAIPIPKADPVAMAEAHVAEAKDPHSTIAPVRMDWRRLSSKTPPDRVWEIDHWLGFFPTLIAGRGGIGKTLLAQTLGTALGIGRDYIDRIPRPLRVLLWACEDDHDELWRRQIGINDYFGVGMDEIDGKFIVESRIGCENTLFSVEYGRGLWTPEYERLRQQVNDLQVDVLFLDNIGQTFAGNKADEHQVTRFTNGKAGLVSGRPFCPVLLGHPARAQGSEFSGAAAWENSVRMRWYLGESLPDQKEEDRDPTSDVRYLAKRKQNYTAKDYRRFTYANGILVPDAPEIAGPPGIVEAIRRRNAERAVLDAVGWLRERNLSATHSHNSPARYLPKLMAENRIDSGFTRAELAAALTRLIGDKRLLVDQPIGKSEHRKLVLGLVLPSESTG